MSKIIKNTTGVDVEVGDTGVTVSANSSYTIPPQDYDIWAGSEDIVLPIANGTIVVNDGLEDLSNAYGVSYVQGRFNTTLDLGGSTVIGPQGPPGDIGENGFGIYAFSNTAANGTILKARGLAVSKTATGTYQYSFTTATPDANYIPTASFFNIGTNTDTNYFIDSKTVNGFILTTGIGDNGTSPDSLADFNHGVTVLGDASPQGVTSAYEAWLSLGNTGTEQDFLDTLVGEQGIQGIQGVAGGFANYTYSESEAENTTTSSNYQQKLKLTTPSLTQGNYLIQWYCEITSTDNDGVACIVELDDATTIAEIEDDRHHSDDYFKPFSGLKQVTLSSGVHEIDIDYKKLGGTAKIRRARISITGVN